jgi:hypothetical protein
MAYIKPTAQEYLSYVNNEISKMANELGDAYNSDNEYSWQQPGYYALYVTVDNAEGGKVELVYNGKLVYAKQPKHYSQLEKNLQTVSRRLRALLAKDGVLNGAYDKRTVQEAIYEREGLGVAI